MSNKENSTEEKTASEMAIETVFCVLRACETEEQQLQVLCAMADACLKRTIEILDEMRASVDVARRYSKGEASIEDCKTAALETMVDWEIGKVGEAVFQPAAFVFDSSEYESIFDAAERLVNYFIKSVDLDEEMAKRSRYLIVAIYRTMAGFDESDQGNACSPVIDLHNERLLSHNTDREIMACASIEDRGASYGY